MFINFMYPGLKDSLTFNAMVLKQGESSAKHPTAPWDEVVECCAKKG